MFTALFIASGLANNLRAQTTTTGGLMGVVTDPSSSVVPDANVEIRDDGKGTFQETKTDHDGVYRFFFLAPSRYTLKVKIEGFREERRMVNILLGPPVTVNVTLAIAKGNTTVEVTDDATLIQAENGDVSTTMSQLQVSEVPNPGNDLTYIAQTAPGAVMNTDSIGFGGAGNFSMLGMPAVSNLFTINGMNDNNTMSNTNNSGVLGMLLGQNEVQEATIVTNGYSAQFGGAAGANVNYITKSGGNTFHGNAQYYWNGTVLNANDWISNASGVPRPYNSAHQWAGSLGGPIKKDKLFFFFDTEGMNLVLPTGQQVTLPSPQFEAATMANIDSIFGPGSASHKFYEQIFTQYNNAQGASAAKPGSFSDPLGCQGWVNPNDPNDSNRLGTTVPCAVHYYENIEAPASQSLVSGRLDWNLRTNDRLFLLIQYDHGQFTNYVDPISPIFNSYSHQPTWQGQFNETHTFSPTSANQFLLAGTYVKNRTGVANSSQALAALPVTLNWWNEGQAFNWVGGLDYSFGLPSGSTTITYQISDDFVKTRGKHKFGLGINFLRTYWRGGGAQWSEIPQLLPMSIDAFFFGGTDPSSPNTDFTTIYQTFSKGDWNNYWFYSLGLYGQEEWHARANLTLTFALRADHQSNPVCESRCFARLTGPFRSVSHDPNQPYNQAIQVNLKQAFVSTDNLVWSPRFSFAWQPLGISRNMVLRGGVGIFYDPLPGGLVTPSDYPPLHNFFPISGYNLAPGETPSLSQAASAANAAFMAGFASGQTLAQIQAADPNFTPPGLGSRTNTVHSPQFQKWSLQVQQNFGASRSLTVSYFGNHGIHEPTGNANSNAFGFASFPTKPCSSPPVAPCYDSRFSLVGEMDPVGVSNYHGMVISFEQRITRWGSGVLQANYTYGHALDEVSNEWAMFAFEGAGNLQDGNNPRGSYGSADYDVRHLFNASYVWELPIKAVLHGHGKDYLVNGWQVSGAIFAHTGMPYTVFDNRLMGELAATNNLGNPIYAIPVAPLSSLATGPCGKGASIPSATVPCLTPQTLGDGSPNPRALFVQSGCETGFNTGNLPGPNGPCSGPPVTSGQGRNHFRGPGFVNTDFAVMKHTRIPNRENLVFSMGLQFFNFFNHPNFGQPDNGLADGPYGQITYLEQSPTSILGSTTQANVARRMIQVKAQLRF
jgi:hypothetical protein